MVRVDFANSFYYHKGNGFILRCKLEGIPIRLREYEYLLAIAKEKSIVRAAQSLYISQPALSRLLQNVEMELGVTLFERGGKGMVPTPAGELYLENAKRLVRMNEDFYNTLHRSSGAQEILLAYPMIYSGFVTGQVVPELSRRAYPISVISQPTSQHSILNGLLDERWPLALGIVTEEYASLLGYRVIGKQEMVLAVPKGHSLERFAQTRTDSTYPVISANYLAAECFLMPRNTSYSGRYAKNYFAANRIHPPVLLHTQLTSPLYQAVASGAGIAILPSLPLRHMNLEQAITYLSLDTSQTVQKVGVLFRRDHAMNRAEEKLIEIMAETFT